MRTTNIVGLIALVLGVCVAIVGVALVAREQPVAWAGVLLGAVLMRVSYSLLRG